MGLIQTLRLASVLDGIGDNGDYEKADALDRHVLAQIGYINQNPSINWFLRPWSDHAQEFKDSDSKRQKFHQSTIPTYGSGYTQAPEDFSVQPKKVQNVNVSESAKQILQTISARPCFLNISLRGCGAQGSAVFDVKMTNKPQGDRQFPVSTDMFVDFMPDTEGHENGILDWNGKNFVFQSPNKCKPQTQNTKEVSDTSTTLFNMDGGSGVNGPAYVVNDYKSIGMNGGKTGPFEWNSQHRTEGVGSWKNAMPT